MYTFFFSSHGYIVTEGTQILSPSILSVSTCILKALTQKFYDTKHLMRMSFKAKPHIITYTIARGKLHCFMNSAFFSNTFKLLRNLTWYKHAKYAVMCCKLFESF